jgi:ABC-2 type transport system ATP-binding protein
LLELRRTRDVTLFLTTHYMDEAENCDRIAIIDRGRIIALDSPRNLKARVGGDVIRLSTADDAAAAAEIQSRFHRAATAAADGLQLEIENGPAFVPGLVRGLSVTVRSVTVHPPTLDDVFLRLTGREIRNESATNRDQLRARVRRMGRAGR